MMISTFDRMMKNASFKEAFDEEYKALVISELIGEMMEGNDSLSVRKGKLPVLHKPTARKDGDTPNDSHLA